MEDALLATFGNLKLTNERDTVVFCVNSDGELKILINSKLPANGVTINYKLMPTLNTALPSIADKAIFSLASISIDLKNKIQKGEIYSIEVSCVSLSKETNIVNLKGNAVWQ